nr:unnamed protein product [Spirometra erinaceieuropaei]
MSILSTGRSRSSSPDPKQRQPDNSISCLRKRLHRYLCIKPHGVHDNATTAANIPDDYTADVTFPSTTTTSIIPETTQVTTTTTPLTPNTSGTAANASATTTLTTKNAPSIPTCLHYDRTFTSRIDLAGNLRIHLTETGEAIPGAPTHTRHHRLSYSDWWRICEHRMGLPSHMRHM